MLFTHACIASAHTAATRRVEQIAHTARITHVNCLDRWLWPPRPGGYGGGRPRAEREPSIIPHEMIWKSLSTVGAIWHGPGGRCQVDMAPSLQGQFAWIWI